MLIVDRSLQVKDGELTVKRLEKRGRSFALVAANTDYTYPPIEIADGPSFEVWGVVSHVVRSMR